MRKPFFLDGRSGPLFCQAHLPDGAQDRHVGVLLVAPFAEEANKSRAVFNVLATELARRGRSVLLPDLHGTGDSAGDFGAADPDSWHRDLLDCSVWLEGHTGRRPVLLGLRLGALLAARIAAPGDRLICWQPVVSGKTLLTQFLRLRLAASMGAGGAARERTADLRARLAAGETIEVAGYAISPAMAAGLDALSLVSALADAPVNIDWLEVAADADRPLLPVSQKAVQAWRELGHPVNEQVVQGSAFWATQEIATAPQLVAASVQAVCKR